MFKNVVYSAQVMFYYYYTVWASKLFKKGTPTVWIHKVYKYVYSCLGSLDETIEPYPSVLASKY